MNPQEPSIFRLLWRAFEDRREQLPGSWFIPGRLRLRYQLLRLRLTLGHSRAQIERIKKQVADLEIPSSPEIDNLKIREKLNESLNSRFAVNRELERKVRQGSLALKAMTIPLTFEYWAYKNRIFAPSRKGTDFSADEEHELVELIQAYEASQFERRLKISDLLTKVITLLLAGVAALCSAITLLHQLGRL
jgi:hypothetical protein